MGQLGECRIVTRGQVLDDLPSLVLNDIVIIEKPFAGRGNRLFVLDGTDETLLRGRECPLIVVEAREKQMPASAAGRNFVCARELSRVFFKTFGAQALGSEWRLFGTRGEMGALPNTVMLKGIDRGGDPTPRISGE